MSWNGGGLSYAMTKQDFTKGLIGIGTSTLLGGMSGGFGTGLSGGAMNAAASFGVNTLASGIDVSGGGRVRYSFGNISGKDVAGAGIGAAAGYLGGGSDSDIRNKLMTGTLTNLMTAGYEGIANGHNFTNSLIAQDWSNTSYTLADAAGKWGQSWGSSMSGQTNPNQAASQREEDVSNLEKLLGLAYVGMKGLGEAFYEKDVFPDGTKKENSDNDSLKKIHEAEKKKYYTEYTGRIRSGDASIKYQFLQEGNGVRNASGQTNSQANKYGTKVLVDLLAETAMSWSVDNSDSPMWINDLSTIGGVGGYHAKFNGLTNSGEYAGYDVDISWQTKDGSRVDATQGGGKYGPVNGGADVFPNYDRDKTQALIELMISKVPQGYIPAILYNDPNVIRAINAKYYAVYGRNIITSNSSQPGHPYYDHSNHFHFRLTKNNH